MRKNKTPEEIQKRKFSEELIIAANQNVKARSYWLNQLGGDPVKTGFPYDTKNKKENLSPDVVNFTFPTELSSLLKRLSKGSDYTLHVILAAGLILLFHKYTGNNDITFITPIYQQEKETEFINTALVLRNLVDNHMSFKELLLRVRQTVVEAGENQDYPLEILMEQLNMPLPGEETFLFDSALLLENIHHKKYLRHVNLNIIFSFLRKGHTIEGTVEYNRSLYEKSFMESIAGYFIRLLQNTLLNLDLPISQIDLLLPGEKEQLLNEFNDTVREYPRHQLLHQLFARQVEKSPESIGLAFENRHLTYRELDKRAHRLAGVLQKKGVQPDVIVGLEAGMFIETIIGMLGILNAGGAFLPIDPGYPQERIQYMLKDSNTEIFLTTTDLAGEITWGKEILDISDTINRIPTPHLHLSPAPVICLPACSTYWPGTCLAYVIYTSGSTGKPKGVMIQHDNIVNQICGLKEMFFNCEPMNHILLAPFTFDPSVQHVFSPLTYGGKLYLANNETRMDAEKLLEFIVANRIAIIDAVPAQMSVLAEFAQKYRGLKLKIILLAGEVFSYELYVRLVKMFNANTIINIYGPTEATINSTCYLCQKEKIEPDTDLPIGKPLVNYKIRILDGALNLLPIRVAGQIFIAGAGIARGYFNWPELTREKFLENPHCPGERMYASGDLGKWLADGNIEFLGRMDHQVKIRGSRIELGEVQQQLLTYGKIKEAIVLVREDNNEKYLCAYLVAKPGETSIEPDLIREYLSHRLPDYMVPTYFFQLAEIPLTPHGKIDRKALPEPGPDGKQDYVAPRDKIEEKLVNIWSGVLNLDAVSIGIDSDFFEIGGHSLKATILTSKITRELKIKIPLAEVFRGRTIRVLAQYIKREKGDESKYAAVEAVEKREYYPLSSAQKRMYFLQQVDINSTAYNMPLGLALGKDVDKDKLESTLEQLIRRHESLRTSFEQIQGQVVQKVHDHREFKIDYYESQVPGAKNFIYSFIGAFDLSQAPLLRSVLFRHKDGTHNWLVDMHHIVSDGTSQSILMEDFFALYRSHWLKPLRLHYKDYSQWQNRLMETGRLKSQENYWKTLYRGEIPRLRLPTDFERPEVFTFTGDHCTFVLDQGLSTQFKSLATAAGGTLYMCILAALNVLFYKYSGQQDIIIGSGVAGRPHADLQGIIGMFINTLALRNHPGPGKTFRSFLQEVINNSIEAFENQDVQFEELVDQLDLERNPSRNPIFDVSMVVQNFRQTPINDIVREIVASRQPTASKTAEDTHEVITYQNPTSKFDLTFFVHEVDDNIYFHLEYYTGIFKQDTVRRIAAHLRQVIMAAVDHPDIQLSVIDIIPEQEKNQLLYGFNDTAHPVPGEKSLVDLIEKQVDQTPNRTAVVFSGYETPGEVKQNHFLTYKELEHRANQLARYLCAGKGIGGEQRVGIALWNPLLLAMAVIAIFKSGSAFVPLDPGLAEERLQYMIDDAAIGIVVSEKKHIKRLNRLQWACNCFDRFICLDSLDVDNEEETEKSQLMDRELWQHVGETANDEITGGGWISSYTGNPFSRQEMDEYGDNILKKLEPLLHKNMRVLEIGTSSGITMYRIAPRVGFYYGTDLSEVIIQRNRENVSGEGHGNIKLACIQAHEVCTLEERDFDLVILNSVIQCFHGHNYLRRVIKQCIAVLGDRGYLFIGDVMDLRRKKDLQQDLEAFKYTHLDQGYTTKTDLSAELFIPREFWENTAANYDCINEVTCTPRLYTIENELTRFRYDTLITVDKTGGRGRARNWPRRKIRDDQGALSRFSGSRPGYYILPHNLFYIIYTSGTTGMPRGVEVEHRSIVNMLLYRKNQYGFTGHHRSLQLFSYSFDGFVTSFFTPLLSGTTQVMLAGETRGDIQRIRESVRMHGISHMISVPSLVDALWETSFASDLKSLQWLTLAGESLKLPLLQKIMAKNPHLEIINEYGVTEAAVMSTLYRHQEKETRIKIGTPIWNTAIYILDNHHRLRPVGVPGELCITGTGTARGYLNNPELTAEKFGHDNKKKSEIKKFNRAPDRRRQKIYRTGDLARWLDDGSLQFLGRIDHQVKIRGYRVELEEIRHRLLKHPSVKEAVVTGRKNPDGGTYLCAYFVPLMPAAADTGELKAHLTRTLPDYMVPTHFIPLEVMPLTPNGKIDRSKLPEPGEIVDECYTAPRDRVEKGLVQIWSEVLNIAREIIGIDSNFFEIGGHSLKAAVVISKIRQQMNTKVPLAEVFKHQTVRALALYIKKTGKSKYVGGKAVEKKEYYPLSSAQRRLYILQQMDAEKGIAYNMPSVWQLEGNLDMGKFGMIFHQLIRRHESLRTFFTMVDDVPVQWIIEENYKLQITNHKQVTNYKLQLTNKTGSSRMSPYPDAGSQGLGIGSVIHTFIRPFDLSQAPLLRVELIKMNKQMHILMMDMHHIISDGLSVGIFVKEFMELYAGRKLPPLKVQYKDYSQLYNSPGGRELIKEQETYWLKQFDMEVPVLELPADYPRPMVQSFAGGNVHFQINKEETRALNTLARQQDVTLFMLLLSAYTVFLSKLSGQEDIVVGTPAAGRGDTDWAGIMGMFVNTLALRNFPGGGKTFNRFLREIKENTIKAFENQDYPYDDLVEQVEVERDTGRNPLFDTMFALQNFDIPDVRIPGFKITPYPYESRISKFDLTLSAVEIEDRLDFTFEYCTCLFKEETIQRFIGFFKKTVSFLLENDETRISAIEIITREEKNRVLQDFNDTGAEYPRDKTIHRLFEEQVEKTPDNIAVVAMGEALIFMHQHNGDNYQAEVSITYNQLNQRANQLARLLWEEGKQPEAIIATMMKPSLDIVIGILGILKSGGAYLPINPEYPARRIRQMLNCSGASTILTHREIFQKKSLESIYQQPHLRLINLEDIEDQLRTQSKENLEVAVGPSHWIYIIFTSGTTGSSNGVGVYHQGFVNLVHWFIKDFALHSGDINILLTSLGFDLTQKNLFVPLVTGSGLYIPGFNYFEPGLLLEKINEKNVTWFNCTPSMFYMLVEFEESTGKKNLSSLRYIFLGGEPIRIPKLIDWLERGDCHAQLVNTYGPTECTDICASYRIQAPRDFVQQDVPVGKPVDNVQLYVLNNDLQPLPVGIPGELAIGGAGIGAGYVNDCDLTAQKFLRLCFSDESQQRLIYRTGDRVKWMNNGNIQFLGRLDHQVKIRGFRIELKEIENQLLAYEKVKEAVVLVREDKNDKYLCAYIAAKPGEIIPDIQKGLREHLSHRLPDYMVPSYFVLLDKVPLTPNGKVDRKALPAPMLESGDDYEAPRDYIEKKLVDLWSELLDVEMEKISINANFFHLGGHSLMATVMLSRVYKEFNVKVPLAEIFRTPVIKKFARIIRSKAPSRFIAIEPGSKREYYPLSLPQGRFYLFQQMEPESVTYNLPMVLILEGHCRLDKFEEIFQELVERHQDLRASFELVDEEPVQRINDRVKLAIHYYEAAEEEVDGIIRDLSRPFDLTRAPLMRAALIKVAEARYILAIVMHHIITDGISINLFTVEFLKLIAGKELLPLKLQYTDFALWQNSEPQKKIIKEQGQYWYRKFQDGVPELDFPVDYKRPRVSNSAGDSISFQLAADTTQELRELAAAEQASVYMVLFSFYYVLLRQLTGKEDIVVGTAVSGRSHPDLMNIIGLFFNTLPIRHYLNGEMTFKTLLTGLKENILQAFENQDYPLDRLIEDLAAGKILTTGINRNPLFDTMFSLQNFETRAGSIPDIEIPGLKFTPYRHEAKISRCDLFFIATESDEIIEVILEYDTALLKKSTLEQIKEYYMEIVDQIIKNKEIKLKDISISSEFLKVEPGISREEFSDFGFSPEQ